MASLDVLEVISSCGFAVLLNLLLKLSLITVLLRNTNAPNALPKHQAIDDSMELINLMDFDQLNQSSSDSINFDEIHQNSSKAKT